MVGGRKDVGGLDAINDDFVGRVHVALRLSVLVGIHSHVAASYGIVKSICAHLQPWLTTGVDHGYQSRVAQADHIRPQTYSAAKLPVQSNLSQMSPTSPPAADAP